MRTVTRRIPAATRLGAASLTVLALGALTLGALSGCVTAPSPHSSSPVPQSTPLFATDDEALAAATKAYAAYLKMSDTIAHDGGAHPERIKDVATGDALQHLLEDIEAYSDQNIHTTGNTTFDSTKLQSYTASDGEGVSVYVCEDVSQIDVLGSSGESLVNKDRDARTPFSATLRAVKGKLLLSSKSVWKGSDFCL